MTEAGAGTPASELVLLIEDNSDNQMIYQTFLEHVGYRVLIAEDGEKGLDYAFTKNPDLILLDVSIPLVSGWDIARQLKSDPRTKRIPILAVTGHATATDRARAGELGLEGFHPKPIEPRRLAEEVRAALSRAKGEG